VAECGGRDGVGLGAVVEGVGVGEKAEAVDGVTHVLLYHM
jgi:hypothetical protein